jgi:hypothetical protein
VCEYLQKFCICVSLFYKHIYIKVQALLTAKTIRIKHQNHNFKYVKNQSYFSNKNVVSALLSSRWGRGGYFLAQHFFLLKSFLYLRPFPMFSFSLVVMPFTHLSPDRKLRQCAGLGKSRIVFRGTSEVKRSLQHNRVYLR